MNLTTALLIGAGAFLVAGAYMLVIGDPPKNYGVAGVVGTLVSLVALCSAIRDAGLINLPEPKGDSYSA